MNKNEKVSISEYLGALLRYLQSPKTVFDIKDRAKALVLFVLIIILLQYLVNFLGY